MAKKTKQKQTAEPKARGGRKEGSGRPSWFRGKSESATSRGADAMYDDVNPTSSVRMTSDAWKILNAGCERLTRDALSEELPEVSRSSFIEGLIRKYGKGFTLGALKSVR